MNIYFLVSSCPLGISPCNCRNHTEHVNSFATLINIPKIQANSGLCFMAQPVLKMCLIKIFILYSNLSFSFLPFSHIPPPHLPHIQPPINSSEGISSPLGTHQNRGRAKPLPCVSDWAMYPTTGNELQKTSSCTQNKTWSTARGSPKQIKWLCLIFKYSFPFLLSLFSCGLKISKRLLESWASQTIHVWSKGRVRNNIY